MLQSASHQIVQSPTRLGLLNPNSPAVQSPGSSKLLSQKPSSSSQQPPQQPILLPSKPISPALLSLLPPLPRAQALLLQMASLASKIFDVSPNRSSWLSSFRGSLPTFLPAQVNSMAVPPLDSSPTTTKDILVVFTSLQTQLFEAVAELQEILDLQASRQKLIEEIEFNESAIIAFTNKLREAEQVLDMLVDDYADYCRPKGVKLEEDDDEDSPCTTTITSRLNLSDILSYAHKISYTTFAPPEFGAGQAPLRAALPPAPQEEQMRASQLYNFANLDVGLPRVAEEKDKVIDPLMDVLRPTSLVDGNSLAGLGLQGLITPNIMVPPGWKPGMPVELPRDMPIPPPGWKPGDPVQLSQLQSLPFRVGNEDHRPLTPPRTGHIAYGAPDPIQVEKVVLDYDITSSDEGSSEDD
ncbi:hypothetical protein Droror1_Dr00008728 [Drosera rotundifolia]